MRGEKGLGVIEVDWVGSEKIAGLGCNGPSSVCVGLGTTELSVSCRAARWADSIGLVGPICCTVLQQNRPSVTKKTSDKIGKCHA